MAHIKRKYIDSHWLMFIFQGAIAALFGCVTLFTAWEKPSSLMPVIGMSTLSLGIVEFANVIYRSYKRHGWLVSILVALFDLGFGIALLILGNETSVCHIIMLSVYALLRGIFEIIIGFRTTVDPTDRFIWVLCGVSGAIFSAAILNSAHLGTMNFVRFFGAYMVILGVLSLVYGVHNRTQEHNDREARSEAAQSRAKEKASLGGSKSQKAAKTALNSPKDQKANSSAKKSAKTTSEKEESDLIEAE